MNELHEHFFEDKMNDAATREFLKSLKTDSEKEAFIEQWFMHQALLLKMDEKSNHKLRKSIITEIKNQQSTKIVDPQQNISFNWLRLIKISAAAALIFSLTLLVFNFNSAPQDIISVERSDKRQQNFVLNSGVKIKI